MIRIYDIATDIQQLAQELASNIKTEKDLNEFSAVLKKLSIEAALNAEQTELLGFDKNEQSSSSNKRNGSSQKTIKSPEGFLELEIPRDRDDSFSPQRVKKHQTRITSIDEKILALYSKGMINREIVQFFKGMYDADVSASLISRVTDSVIEKVIDWQNRALDPIYRVVYFACIELDISRGLPRGWSWS